MNRTYGYAIFVLGILISVIAGTVNAGDADVYASSHYRRYAGRMPSYYAPGAEENNIYPFVLYSEQNNPVGKRVQAYKRHGTENEKKSARARAPVEHPNDVVANNILAQEE